jgi:hypothetical protein
LVGLGWLEKDYVKDWLRQNPSVVKWLDNSERIQTKNTHANNLYKFCEAVGETPEALRIIRYTSDKKKLAEFREKHGIPLSPAPEGEEGPPENGGYVILDLLQGFIRHGTMLDGSRAGKKANEGRGRTIEVAKLSKHRREGFYYAARSYFASMRGGELPTPETAFKITETNRIKREEFEKEGDAGIQELNRIINAAKEPYRTLFSAAKYGMLERSALVQLHNYWEKIRADLQAGKSETRIDFTYRKSNEQPYYTFLPTKIFNSFRNQAANPFVTRSGKPINQNDLNRVWPFARRRAGITKPVTLQHIRDLIRTTATQAGVEESCAELMMGHTVDPLRYNQIIDAPDFVKGHWEKLRQFIDGENKEWKKDVEALTQRLEKTETARRDDRRLMIQQFLADFRYPPRSIKQLAQQHGGDLANLTLEEMRELAGKAEPEFQPKKRQQEQPDGPPPIRVMTPGADADRMIEEGWEPHRLQDGRWRLEWKYNSKPPPPPKRPSQAPNTSAT